jgi:hypothetical protein
MDFGCGTAAERTERTTRLQDDKRKYGTTQTHPYQNQRCGISMHCRKGKLLIVVGTDEAKKRRDMSDPFWQGVVGPRETTSRTEFSRVVDECLETSEGVLFFSASEHANGRYLHRLIGTFSWATDFVADRYTRKDRV